MSIFPTKILVATDGSEEAELAATTAAILAQKTGSELHVVHVFGIAPVGPPVYPEATDLQGEALEEEAEERISEQRAREVLEAEVGKVRSAGGTVVEAHLLEGRTAPEIVALAEEIGAGLIVMGSRGHGGLRRALMGSVSDSVMRHAHCPVLVVRSEPVSFPTKILLATDGSKDAELATATAADLANSTGSELHVVSVFPGSAYVHPYYEDRFPEAAERLRREAREERQEMLDEQVERIRKAGKDVAQTHIRTGEAAKEIVALAEEIGVGLIAMGSHGLGGIRRALIGSVSAAVVPHAHCPVMVVRPEKGHIA
jgi:nucleotide-binding universal stress UspA family protein